MIDNDFFIKKILAQYNIVDCESQKDIPGWGKTIRKTLRSEGKSYFLKEKAPYLTKKEFKIKTSIHTLLKLSEGPVSTLVATRDKKQYTKFSNRYFELHEWVPGRFINYNCINEIRMLGEHTGILTKKLKILYQDQTNIRKFPYPRARSRWFPDTIHSIRRYFNNLFTFHYENNEFQSILSNLYKIVSEVMNVIDWNNLPQSIIHGDLSSDNAIFNSQLGNITFIDFDNVRVSKRIWDIARLTAIIGLLHDNKLDRKQLNTEFAYDKASVLLSGYEQNFALSYIEKSNIANVIIINLILTFLSEFDIDDLENSTFSKKIIVTEYENLLNLVHSLLRNEKKLI